MLKVVSNVSVTAYGWDCPAVSCCIDARPTASISNYIQRIGRVSRAFPSPPGPRAYQARLLNELREQVRLGKRPLAWAPAGAGKSHIACDMAGMAVAKGKRVAFLINRRVLVDDLMNRMRSRGIPATFVMAGRPQTDAPVKICSVDTIASRDITLDVHLLFVDEARIMLADQYFQIIDRHRHIPTILMDATPHRQDGKPLSKIADVIVYGPRHDELIADGYLVRTRVFSPESPDLSSVQVAGGEFNEVQTAPIMMRPKLMGNLVKEWLYRGENRPTIVHCTNRLHSQAVTDRFLAIGVPAASVDGNTPDAERDEIWARLSEGAQPKTDALVIDVAGNWYRHGFVEDDREWSLDGGEVGSGKPCKQALTLRRCPKCFAVFRSHISTCECGASLIKTTKQIKEQEAVLEEKKREAIKRYQSRMTEEQKHDKLKKLIWTCAEKDHKPGSLFIKYKLATAEDLPPKWKPLVFSGVPTVRKHILAKAEMEAAQSTLLQAVAQSANITPLVSSVLKLHAESVRYETKLAEIGLM